MQQVDNAGSAECMITSEETRILKCIETNRTLEMISADLIQKDFYCYFRHVGFFGNGASLCRNLSLKVFVVVEEAAQKSKSFL